MCVEAVLKARRTPLGPTSPSACSSATKAFEAALKAPRWSDEERVVDWAKIRGRTSRRSTDRIARVACNVGICRNFVRSILHSAIARGRIIIARPWEYRAPKISSVCRSFILYTVPAVGEVDTLTTFAGTSGLCR